METLTHLQAALLHTLWQGPLIAAAMAMLLVALPARRPNVRYAVAIFALAAFLIAFFVTWSLPADLWPESIEQAKSGAAQPTQIGIITTNTDTNRYFSNSLSEIGSSTAAYTNLLIPTWLLGATLMLFRLLYLLNAAQSLARNSTGLADPAMAEIFAKLRRALGAPARTALRFSTEIATPIALGLVNPLVLLPTAFANGLPPAQLHAILAHELAHIRRHDYLVNLLQLLAEAAFYFNPALWWISRQIRVEREACCDHLAALHTGGPLDYAHALAAIARLNTGGHAPQPALAMGDAPGPLLDRVRRLLLPTHRPHLRLPWYTLGATLALTVLLLFATYSTTQAATHAIVTYLRLNDAERIDYLTEMNKKSGNYLAENMDQVRINGRLITLDGSELESGRCDISFIGRGPGNFCQSTWLRKDGSFKGETALAATYVQVIFPGYEPVCAGPFYPSASNLIEDVEIPLTIATPARILLRDDAGNPIANATATCYYKFFKDFSCGGIRERTAGDDGVLLLEQTTETIPVNLTVSAPGFQTTSFDDLVAAAGQETLLRLAKDVPVEIQLINGATQAPVDAANFYLVRSGNINYGGGRPCLTEALGAGRFLIKGLNCSLNTIFAAHAPALGGKLFQLEPGKTTQPITVEIPEIYLHGTIHGDLEKLKDNDGNIMLYAFGTGWDAAMEIYSQQYDLNDVPVTIIDGVGHFAMNGLFPGKVELVLGNESVSVPITGPVDDHIIQFGAPPSTETGMLAINLKTPPGVSLPNGEATIRVRSDKLAAPPDGIKVPIVDGIGTAQVPTGVSLAISLEGVPGYSFEPSANGPPPSNIYTYIAPDTGTSEFSHDVIPTGAITGTAITANGVPVRRQWVYIGATAEPAAEVRTFATSDAETDDSGSFTIRDLPFERSYTLTLFYRGELFEQNVTLTTGHPIAQVTFTPPAIPPQRSVRVRALQPDGSPLGKFDAVMLLDGGSNESVRSEGGHTTVEFTEVDSGVPGRIVVVPERDFQPATVELDPDATEVSITVLPGRRATGRVLNKDDLQPVPGIQIFVRVDDATVLNATTGEDGLFSFTNLPDAPVIVDVDKSELGNYVYLDQPAPFEPDGSTVLYLVPWEESQGN